MRLGAACRARRRERWALVRGGRLVLDKWSRVELRCHSTQATWKAAMRWAYVELQPAAASQGAAGAHALRAGQQQQQQQSIRGAAIHQGIGGHSSSSTNNNSTASSNNSDSDGAGLTGWLRWLLLGR